MHHHSLRLADAPWYIYLCLTHIDSENLIVIRIKPKIQLFLTLEYIRLNEELD
jgi:hypothetical protein